MASTAFPQYTQSGRPPVGGASRDNRIERKVSASAHASASVAEQSHLQSAASRPHLLTPPTRRRAMDDPNAPLKVNPLLVSQLQARGYSNTAKYVREGFSDKNFTRMKAAMEFLKAENAAKTPEDRHPKINFTEVLNTVRNWLLPSEADVRGFGKQLLTQFERHCVEHRDLLSRFKTEVANEPGTRLKVSSVELAPLFDEVLPHLSEADQKTLSELKEVLSDAERYAEKFKVLDDHKSKFTGDSPKYEIIWVFGSAYPPPQGRLQHDLEGYSKLDTIGFRDQHGRVFFSILKGGFSPRLIDSFTLTPDIARLLYKEVTQGCRAAEARLLEDKAFVEASELGCPFYNPIPTTQFYATPRGQAFRRTTSSSLNLNQALPSLVRHDAHASPLSQTTMITEIDPLKDLFNIASTKYPFNIHDPETGTSTSYPSIEIFLQAQFYDRGGLKPEFDYTTWTAETPDRMLVLKTLTQAYWAMAGQHPEFQALLLTTNGEPLYFRIPDLPPGEQHTRLEKFLGYRPGIPQVFENAIGAVLRQVGLQIQRHISIVKDGTTLKQTAPVLSSEENTFGFPDDIYNPVIPHEELPPTLLKSLMDAIEGAWRFGLTYKLPLDVQTAKNIGGDRIIGILQKFAAST